MAPSRGVTEHQPASIWPGSTGGRQGQAGSPPPPRPRFLLRCAAGKQSRRRPRRSKSIDVASLRSIACGTSDAGCCSSGSWRVFGTSPRLRFDTRGWLDGWGLSGGGGRCVCVFRLLVLLKSSVDFNGSRSPRLGRHNTRGGESKGAPFGAQEGPRWLPILSRPNLQFGNAGCGDQIGCM